MLNILYLTVGDIAVNKAEEVHVLILVRADNEGFKANLTTTTAVVIF